MDASYCCKEAWEKLPHQRSPHTDIMYPNCRHIRKNADQTMPQPDPAVVSNRSNKTVADGTVASEARTHRCSQSAVPDNYEPSESGMIGPSQKMSLTRLHRETCRPKRYEDYERY